MIKRRKSGKLNILTRRLLIPVLSLTFIWAVSAVSYADVATDTLSVKVGYTGMELNEYVEVGTYHWTQLQQDLPLYEIPLRIMNVRVMGQRLRQ